MHYEGKDNVDELRSKVDNLIRLKADAVTHSSAGNYYMRYAHILEMRACSIEQTQTLKELYDHWNRWRSA